MFSVNFVTFAYCKHDSLENVSSADTFQVVPSPAAKKEYLFIIFIICPFIFLTVEFPISKHSGENRVILLQKVAK